MSAADAQQQQDAPWYAEGVLDGGVASDRICAVMRELADDWRDDAVQFAAFARWVRGEALSQEVFGETIEAWPEVLGVAWYAWQAAGSLEWYETESAPPSGAAGGVVTASHRVDPPAAGTAVPSSLPLPRTAPAGVPPAPAGVGPADDPDFGVMP